MSVEESNVEQGVRQMQGVVTVMTLDRYERLTGDIVTDQTQWSPEGFVPTPLSEKYPGAGLTAVVVAYPEDSSPRAEAHVDHGTTALVVVVRADRGYPVWENPANGADSLTRYVAAALLLTDAQNVEHG